MVERLQIPSSQGTMPYPTTGIMDSALILEDDELLSIGNATSAVRVANNPLQNKDQSSSENVSPPYLQCSSMPSHPVGLVNTSTVIQLT